MGCLRSWVGLLREVGHRSALIAACKDSVERILFKSTSHDSQSLILLDYSKKVLPLDTLKPFFVAAF